MARSIPTARCRCGHTAFMHVETHQWPGSCVAYGCGCTEFEEVDSAAVR